MVTVHREAGFRIMIFSDDHEPAHVHVFGDGHAKIDLIGKDGEVAVVAIDGMKVRDVRRASRIVEEQREALLARWSEIHG
jgi:hypothetical protein